MSNDNPSPEQVTDQTPSTTADISKTRRNIDRRKSGGPGISPKKYERRGFLGEVDRLIQDLDT